MTGGDARHTIAHVAEVAQMRFSVSFHQAVDDVLDAIEVLWPENERPDVLTDEQSDDVLACVKRMYYAH